VHFLDLPIHKHFKWRSCIFDPILALPIHIHKTLQREEKKIYLKHDIACLGKLDRYFTCYFNF